MESIRSSRKSGFLKTGKYFLADINANLTCDGDKWNKTQKNFNRILDLKHNLLKNQILRVRNASTNLKSYQRLKKLALFQTSLIKRQQTLQIDSATKIQKTFRGYISRKRTLPVSLTFHKSRALLKIEELKLSVNNYFFNRAYTEDAVRRIQRSYRSYKKRMVLAAYIRLWQRLKRVKECKEALRVSFQVFGCRLRVVELKGTRELQRRIRAFRESHAFKVISRYWRQEAMTKKKFIKRAKRYKKVYLRYPEEKTRGSIQKEGEFSRKNSERANNSSDKILSKKNSIRKKTKMLPYLPLSPPKLQNKAMMFLIKPKKVPNLSHMISKSVANRLSHNSKDFIITFPKLHN